MAPRLSTTSYAILGLLALRPWTPYELAQQVTRSLDWCWPVSERSVYDQPDRLVSAGFAAADAEPSGRCTYSITEAGRGALAEWLQTRPAPVRMENEPLLRLLFADQGSVDDLRRSLRSLQLSVLERSRLGEAQMVEYLDDGGPFPQRRHLLAMFGDLVTDLYEVLLSWAEGVLEETESWDDTTDLGLTPEAQARLERMIERVQAMHGNHSHLLAPGKP